MSKEKKEVDSTKTLGRGSGINPVELSTVSASDMASMISKSRVNQCLDGSGDTRNSQVLKEILEKDTEGLLTQHQIDKTMEEGRK